MKLLGPLDRVGAVALVTATLAIYCLGALVWFDALGNDDPLYLEPQGSIRAQLAEAWSDTGSPSIGLERRAELPEDVQIALVPRDASILDWRIVPKDFAYPVMISTALHPLGNAVSALVTPLSGLLAAALVAWIVWMLTSSVLSSAGAFMTASLSVVWWSASYGGVSFALTGVAVGLVAVPLLIAEARRPEPGNGWLLFFAGVFGGGAAGFHYASAPWWGAIVVVGCIGSHRAPLMLLRRVIIGASGAAVALSPVLIFNSYVYGAPTATGYTEFATVLDAIGWSAPALGFDVQSFWSNLSTYLLRPELIPVLLMAAWSAPVVRKRQWGVRPIHLAVLAVGYLLLVSVTGAATLWGTNQFRTNASFLRYMAPVYALAIVLAFVTLDELSRTRHRLAFAIPVVFALSIGAVNTVTVAQEAEGWTDSRALIAASIEEREQFRAEIPDGAFVITRRSDKVLFPERSTLIAAYLRTSTEETDLHLYSTFPEIDRLADILVRVPPQTIAIVNDSGWLDSQELLRLERLISAEGRCLVGADALVITVANCGSVVSS